MAEVGKRTGKRTQVGRDVYETSEGEMVSEKSTTFKHKGEWVNVPTIFDGRSYDDDTLRMMLDAEVIKPTSTHTNKEDAIKAASERSESLRFNEGGLADLDGKLKLFNEGGAVMDNLDNQTEESLGWAAEGKKLAVYIPEVSFKDAATFVASMTPIIGDAMAAKDVYDELQKDEPNYYLAGALGGAALVGLIPGLGDVAAKAIKKGAKEVFDVASNIPKVSRKSTPSYTDAELLEADEIISEWGKGNLNNPELRSKLSDKGFTIETKRISPKMTGDDLEVVGPDGNIVRWKDMPRGRVDREADAARTKEGKARLFNEGGAVMDEQMKMAFAEGERVDPVSGNEVPTGSLPEEVRDDIPAQLSEGEYVVPADVVRFFGVKFFEDIRNEAKRGFADMEANGRIGGEPIGMEMAEDELPFDISELQIVDDETEEQPMMNMGGYMRGYADGGLTLPAAVTDMTTATGITSDTSGVPMPVSNLSGIEMKEYVGPNGEITYIQFINGVAQSVIPEGYTAKAAAPTTPAAPAVPKGLGVVTAPDDNNNTAHEDMMREAQKRESIDWTSPDVGIEQYEKTMEQSNSMLAKGFSGLATVLGGPIVAGFMAVAKRHQNKKMLEGTTARLEDPNIRGAEREKWVSIHNRLSGLDEDGKARNSFTEGLANLLTPDDGMEYVNGVLVDTKTGKVLKPGIANSKGNDVVAPTPTPKPKQSGGGSNDNDSHTSMMKAAQSASRERASASVAKSEAAQGIGPSTPGGRTTSAGKETYASKVTRGGGFSKGGLMKKK